MCPMLPFLGTGILVVAYELTVGEDAAELTADVGIAMGIESRGPGVRGWCASRKYDTDGDTARRLDADG